MSFPYPKASTPAWSAALGLAFAFYLTPLSPGSLLLAAAAVAGVAVTLRGLAAARAESSGLRLATLALASAAGLCAGASLRLDEAGSPRPLPDSAIVRDGALPGAPVPPAPRAAEGLPSLYPAGLAGRLSADSGPPGKGYRFYRVEVEELVLAAPGMVAKVSTHGPLRVMAAEGPALTAGMRVAAESGRLLPAAPGAGPLFLVEGTGLLATPPPGLLPRVRGRLRSALVASLDLAGGGGATSGLLEALLSGCRDGLDREEAADYKLAGCAAVLSLSGQHLSILAAAAALVLRPLGGPRRAKAASLALACAFVFVCGPEPALLRSVIMYGIAVATALADRPQTGRNILGLSFMLQAFLGPDSARELSFELSYLALAGLVVLSPRFERLLVPVLPPVLAKAFAASFAAQASTAPLCAVVFGALYPVGLLASVLSGPFVTVFIWWGIAAALACGAFPFLSLWAAPVSRLLHDGLRAMMSWFAGWPALGLVGPWRELAAASVVLGAAIVYALPHAEHALGLRFSPRPQVPPRVGGPCDVQALRPELPREPQRTRAHP